ncbi:MAG: hypothetical protein C0506_02040 [Anaerolinea sp.]|nr:hypothetical protein [Anaerolinea sp.]
MAAEVKALIPPAWVLSPLVAVLLFVGLGYADQTRLHWYAEESHPAPAAQPDRVVGIEYRCEALGRPGQANLQFIGGDPCNNSCHQSEVYNRLMQLTVRTPGGEVYKVVVTPYREFDDFPTVEFGDVWPPPNGLALPQGRFPSCS